MIFKENHGESGMIVIKKEKKKQKHLRVAYAVGRSHPTGRDFKHVLSSTLWLEIFKDESLCHYLTIGFIKIKIKKLNHW